MKAMLSQPMNGKTNEEIVAIRKRAIKELEAAGYEVVNTFFTDEWYNSENMKTVVLRTFHFVSLRNPLKT